MLVPVDQLVGKTLGKYQLGKLLGRGSLSSVYIAQSYETNRTVMLTVFTLPEACTGRARERFMERFTREASTLLQLRQQNIVPVYDFGEQFGYPYLVTPLTEGGSLAGILKQQGRCTAEQTLEVLKQVAAGLDYAHDHGVVHGSLKPSNILLDMQQQVQIAGFGLVKMLAMRGIGQIGHTHPHLFSVGGTLLANATYLAPEVVQGAEADGRADIYALGVILFEMLSGHPPFTGTDPLEIAQKHVEERMPSLQAISPDVPVALDLVLQRALERDPVRRISSAAKLTDAFQRTLRLIQAAPQMMQREPETAPYPTASAQHETGGRKEAATNKQWMGMPGVTSSKLPAVGIGGTAASVDTGKWQREKPRFTGQMPTVQATNAAKADQVKQAGTQKDPSPYWTTEGMAAMGAASTTQAKTGQMPGTMDAKEPETGAQQGVGAKRTGRRKVLIATGGAVAAAVVGVGGFSLLHFIQSKNSAQTAQKPITTQKAQKQPQPTHPAQPKPTQAAQPQPTQAPMQNHQGTQIADKMMAVNSFKIFTNPLDKQESILVRLPNGDFAAYERACTHEGVPVNYDPVSHNLICPRHHSVYDPANKAAVLDGPAPAPLTAVTIQVNADGTVTAG